MVDVKYPEGHKYREMFIVGLYGLLCKYNKYAKLIWTLFMQVENYIEDKSLREIIDENNLELEPNSEEDDDALSSSIHTFITDQNNNLCHILEKPVIVCSNTGTNKEHIMLLLNSWCHEMQHILKGVINAYKIDNSYTYKSIGQLRTGIAIFTYELNKDIENLYITSKYNLLDEAINTIQTTEVIEYAISLTDIVFDEDIKKFLKELTTYENNDYGYDIITQQVRKLWAVDEFKIIIENNIVQGDIEKIENSFNNIMNDENAFKKLDLLLDHIYNSDNDMDCLMNYSENVERFNEIVSIFKTKAKLLK